MKRASLAVLLVGFVCVLLVSGTIVHIRGAHAQAMQSTINGAPNQQIATPGLLPIYDLAGNVIVGAKCFQGSVTSAAATGQWTVPNTPASLGLTAVTSVTATVISPSGSLTSLGGQYAVSVANASITAVNGTVTSPAVVVLGGIAVGFGPTAATVMVRFCGPSS